MDAKTGLLDVGDRRVDLEGLGNCLAGLRTHIVALEAANKTP